MFFIFLNFFCYFFLEFSSPGQVGMEFGTKFFSLFLRLSHLGLDRNKVGMMFFNFLNFFVIIFLIFLPKSGQEWNSGLKLFTRILGLCQPGLDKNNVGKVFFNFLNFFAIFLEFSCPGRVGTKFGTKIFFSPSRPISSRFGQK